MENEKDARDLLDNRSPKNKIEVTEDSSVITMLSKIIELLEQLDWKLWELYGYQKASRDEELLNSNANSNDFETFFAEFRTFMEDFKAGGDSDKSVVSKLFEKDK
jgi:hypothetical protein|tara:strand:- start:1485 stop:1799 length:315 start_codon:yes stop_codon:yes gene_type:complete